MTIFLVSDHHLGHENMYQFVTFDGVTRARPQFANAKEADEAMIERHNAIVGPRDHVWFGGDVAMNRSVLARIRQFNGHKRLILGNHDREPVQAYRDVGFQKIAGSRLFGAKGRPIWFTHIPIHESSLGPNGVNVHGHIHERIIRRLDPSEYQTRPDRLIWQPDPRYVNVCVEQVNYTPVPLDEIERLSRTL